MPLSNADQARVLSRRSKVAALLLKGTRNQFEICGLLGMEPSQRVIISQDFKWIKRQWRGSAIRSWDLLMGRELAKLDLLEAEAWKAWDKSCQPFKSKRVRTAMREGKANSMEDSEEERTEERSGDPRFMEIVWKCIDKRCELLGLNAAQRHEIVVSKGGELPPNDRAILERFEAMTYQAMNGEANGQPG